MNTDGTVEADGTMRRDLTGLEHRAAAAPAGDGGPVEQDAVALEQDAVALEQGAETLHEICERALDELGTTVPPTQLRALLIVARLGGPNLNTLAQELRASMSATSRLCDRLQAAGLIVRRSADRDRREVVISLSNPGARLVGWAGEQRRSELARIADGMTPDDRAALVRGLRAFQATAARLRPSGDEPDRHER